MPIEGLDPSEELVVVPDVDEHLCVILDALVIPHRVVAREQAAGCETCRVRTRCEANAQMQITTHPIQEWTRAKGRGLAFLSPTGGKVQS